MKIKKSYKWIQEVIFENCRKTANKHYAIDGMGIESNVS